MAATRSSVNVSERVVHVVRQVGTPQKVAGDAPARKLIVQLIETGGEHDPTQRGALVQQAREPPVELILLGEQGAREGSKTEIFAASGGSGPMSGARHVARKEQYQKGDGESQRNKERVSTTLRASTGHA